MLLAARIYQAQSDKLIHRVFTDLFTMLNSRPGHRRIGHRLTPNQVLETLPFEQTIPCFPAWRHPSNKRALKWSRPDRPGQKERRERLASYLSDPTTGGSSHLLPLANSPDGGPQ